jgi:1-acyl-sn-glycerol-3-phosphate acyltransferase
MRRREEAPELEVTADAFGPAEADPRRALGSDPFEALDEPDPVEVWLDALERIARQRVESTDSTAEATSKEVRAAVRRLPVPPAVPRRRTPALSEVEVPLPPEGLERFLGNETRRRITALLDGLSASGAYDRFGLSPEALRRTFPLVYALYRFYFRVRSQGHENLPSEGPAILVSNHGGLLPFDGAMTVLDVFLHTDPPRLPRAIVDRWAGTLPYVNVFFARVGQVIGTRENFSTLLDDGELLLEFPEGIEGILKPIHQRYRLQSFHVGFMEHALRARVPIVPVAILGSDDQAPILYDVKPLARRLGLPTAPITPTFPWFGPMGLLPYPVGYRITYGEPIPVHERFGPEAAEDVRLVQSLVGQVRRSVQQLLDRSR